MCLSVNGFAALQNNIEKQQLWFSAHLVRKRALILFLEALDSPFGIILIILLKIDRDCC